jgi:pimeloyl-ACP methyl ester carboxylesterase
MERYCDVAAFSLDGAEKPGLVIALHGLTGDFHQPLDLMSGFSSSFFGVFAPDLRAYGATRLVGAPNDFTRQQLADDVVALLERLGPYVQRARALVQDILGDVTTMDATR